MTDQELKDIVAAVVAELEKSGVDFDYKAEQAKDDDLVFVIRGTAPNYQGVTVTWKGLLDIITAQATQAKNDAVTAKNTANTILTQVQNKGTEITNFVATSKAEIETQKDESVNAVKSVYQSDLNELKGDLVEMDSRLSESKIDGIDAWNTDTISTVYNNICMCYRQSSGSTVYTTELSGGKYRQCDLKQSKKVRIKGYGFDLSSNLCLWIFTDENNNQISHDTIDQHESRNWLELDVPANAKYIYVNGSVSVLPSVEIQKPITDFMSNYMLAKKQDTSISTDYDNLKFPITKGSYCLYDGNLYVSNTNIFTKESFDSNKWDSVTLSTLIDILNRTKVNGMPSWEESPKLIYNNKLICYRGTIGAPVYEIDYSSGIYIKSYVKGLSKVRIKGYGFDLSSNLCLWIFTDENNNQISHDTIDQHGTVGEWITIDVPHDAVYLFVNGATNHVPNSQSPSYSLDFRDSYKILKTSRKFKILALGDSITALNIDSNGWLKYFIEATNGELIGNVASGGACLHDVEGTVYDGNPTITNPTNNVLGNEVQKVLDNNYETPDLIMIAIGTNGGINITKEEINSVYYDSNDELVPIDSIDRKTDAGAYRYCTETLHTRYPNAVIVWCSPIYASQGYRKMDDIESWSESLEIATKYSGQYYIDTLRCGINGIDEKYNVEGEYLEDGLHPNVKGAKKIGYYNASKIIPLLDSKFINTTER